MERIEKFYCIWGRMRRGIVMLKKDFFFWVSLGRNFFQFFFYLFSKLQSNLDNSNIDGSFTMANSNSFLSPYEILPLAQENK